MTNIPIDLDLRRPTWAEIDLDAVHWNYLKIREKARSSDIIAIVKSDAYGHGAIKIAQQLSGEGVNFFGTATVEEAIQLRNAGITASILILFGVTPAQFPLVVQYSLVPNVFSPTNLHALAEFGLAHGKKIPVHLKIDTGMGRLGFSLEEASAVMRSVPDGIDIQGIYTHFANADQPDDWYTRRQIQVFSEFARQYAQQAKYIHAANSPGILHYPESHFTHIRPGVLLYGITPNPGPSEFKPILKLKSKIIFLRRLPKGEPIGYGLKFKASRDSVIATLPIGYNDGLRRALSNRLEVQIGEKMCKISGTISMDLCTVDVTDVPEVRLYDEVTLLGPRNTAWDWAKLLETIPYEITCLMGSRVPRVYYKSGKIYDVYYPK